MVFINNPDLQIERDKDTDTAKLTATCDLVLSEYEKNQVLQGATYQVIGEVYGDDPEDVFGGGDNLRYTFSKRPLIQDWPNFKLSKTFKLGKELDEDDGNDEIYVRFVVRAVDYTAVFVNRTPTRGGIHL